MDILVNNAALHFENKELEELSTKELMKTFETNIFSFFWITKAALPSMKKGCSIINTSSVVAYRGSAALIDYASTKGAIVSFTRSLSSNLAQKRNSCKWRSTRADMDTFGYLQVSKRKKRRSMEAMHHCKERVSQWKWRRVIFFSVQ
ncbi:MAG: SDR family NAD(P)-dependent oxidoreductase [Chitinophagaceae bacterium]